MGSGFLSQCTQSFRNTAGLSSLSIASFLGIGKRQIQATCLFGTDLQAVSLSVPEVNFQELLSHYSEQYLRCGVASVFSNHFDTLDKRISIIINQNTMDFTGYCFNSGIQAFLCLLSAAHKLQLYNTGTEHSSSAQENRKTVSNTTGNCLFCMADQ